MQDYTKDLTILVAGTGRTSVKNLEANMLDFIFGPAPSEGEEELERDVVIIVPESSDIPAGISTLLQWGEEHGMEFSLIQGEDDREAMEKAFEEIAIAHGSGRETAMVMLYDPSSKYEKGSNDLSDREIIGDAKNHAWLKTYNLCEGLIDSFDGFETTDERLKRERLQKEYDAELKRKEAEDKPVKKAVAKKATVPRKQAASKAVAAVDKPLTEEAQKPLVAPLETACVHYFLRGDEQKDTDPLICKNCGELDPEKPLELSGTIAIKPTLPTDLSPVPDEVWKDVAKAVPSTSTVTVKKEDLALLGNSIKDMAVAFSDAMKVFTQILEDN